MKFGNYLVVMINMNHTQHHRQLSSRELNIVKTTLIPLVLLIGVLVGCAAADNTARNQTLIAESGMPPEPLTH
jgi:hypothetical protein